MKQNNKQIEFSYYQLSLLSFLRESHPNKATDIAFIKARSQAAAEAYEEAFNSGSSLQECIDIAHNTLFEGLHFSKHDTIVNVLWNEFSADVSVDEAKETAIRLQPLLEGLFSKYDLSDKFGYSPEYQSLYTEIVGTLQIKLEEDGSL